MDWFKDAQPAGVVRLRGVAGAHARLAGCSVEEFEKARAGARALGLPLVAVEATGDVNQGARSIEEVKALVGALKGQNVMVELGLASTGGYDVPGAPRADTRAGEVLRGVVGAFNDAGVPVSLRHRAGAWMEKIQDSVRVLMRVNRAEYGVVLSIPDWLKADGTGMNDRLHLAAPRLTNLVIDARPATEGYPGAGPLLNTLAGMGYVGPVTLTPGGAGEIGTGWAGVQQGLAGLK